MSAKEGQKVVFSNGNKFNLDAPDGFQSTGMQNIFQKRIKNKL